MVYSGHIGNSSFHLRQDKLREGHSKALNANFSCVVDSASH